VASISLHNLTEKVRSPADNRDKYCLGPGSRVFHFEYGKAAEPFASKALSMDWTQIPDIVGMALLATAFASVLYRSGRTGPALWLGGWLLIIVHFVGLLFCALPGIGGVVAQIVAWGSLVWAGLFFMSDSIPYRKDKNSRLMSCGLLCIFAIYIIVLFSPTHTPAQLNIAALLLTLVPVTVAALVWKQFRHPLRIYIVLMYIALTVFLLAIQNRPGDGNTLALDAILFTTYFNCGVLFLYSHRRAYAGPWIAIVGFFAWASVFVIGPLMQSRFSSVRLDNEVWNLPKYVVAVGMMLVLLENQIEHNRFLALHDDLTELPNRRLFHDRLSGAIERALRTQQNMALLLIDLNHFKEVNDTLGHHVGDQVLKAVSALFQARVRRSDTIARTGGDEFTLILESPITRSAAEEVVSSLQALVSHPLKVGKYRVHIGFSIGVAMYPEDGDNLVDLCICADKCMYVAKRAQYGKEKRPMKSGEPGPDPDPDFVS